MPGYEHTGWSGIMVPAGTPKPIVDLLNAEINKLLAKPEVEDDSGRNRAPKRCT